MNVTLSEKAGDELGRRLIECEVKRKEALAECHLEAEKKREEVRTKLETMLSRHRLKRAGYSESFRSEVDPLVGNPFSFVTVEVVRFKMFC
ncbi:hypothetical protein PRNP1_000086 [Phytophthora ramorum]